MFRSRWRRALCVSAVFEPAKLAVIGNVAPDQIAPLAAPGRSFRPQGARPETLDRRVALSKATPPPPASRPDASRRSALLEPGLVDGGPARAGQEEQEAAGQHHHLELAGQVTPEAELHVERGDGELRGHEESHPASEETDKQKNATAQLQGGRDEREESRHRKAEFREKPGDASGDPELEPLLVAVHHENDGNGDANDGDATARVETRDPSHDAPFPHECTAIDAIRNPAGR